MGTIAGREKPIVLYVGNDQGFYREISEPFRVASNVIQQVGTFEEMLVVLHSHERAEFAIIVDRKVDQVNAVLYYLENLAHRCIWCVVIGEDEFGGFESEGPIVPPESLSRAEQIAASLTQEEQWARIQIWALSCGAIDAFIKERLDINHLARLLNFSVLWKRLGEVFKDHLTGLMNARGFERTVMLLLMSIRDRRRPGRLLAEGIDGDRRHHYPQVVSIAMGDADGFKAINDTRGHLAGDEAIVEMANALAQEMRDADIMARRSGDEFIFCWPGLNLGQAEEKVRELQSKLEAVGYKMSFGLIEVHTHEIGDDVWVQVHEVIDRADQILIGKKQRSGLR